MGEDLRGVVLLYFVVFDDPSLPMLGPFADPVLADKIYGSSGGQVVMVTASRVTRNARRGRQNGSD
jgi:hypothetical protein